MPIDYTLPFRMRQPDIDPTEMISNALTIRQQLRQADATDRQEKLQASALRDADRVRQLISQHGGNLESALPDVMGVSPDAGMAIQTHLGKLAEGRSKTAVESADLDAKRIEGVSKRVEMALQLLGGIDGDNFDAVKQAIAPLVGPDVGQMVSSLLGDAFDPKRVESVRMRGLALKDQIAAESERAKPVTLGQGQVLADPTSGRVLAQGPTAPRQPVQVETVDGRGRPVTRFVDPQVGAELPKYVKPEGSGPDNRSPVAVMGEDGTPVYVRPSEAVGRRPANMREQGRSVTSGDAGRIAELDTSLDDLGVLRDAIVKVDPRTGAIEPGVTGTAAKIGASVPPWVTDLTGWGTDAKKKQAVIDRVKQVIGKALEGGVLRKEDEIKYEKILPTVADTAEIVVSKLNGLDDAIRLRRQRELDAREDAGYDVSRFNARGATQPGGSAPKAPAAGSGSSSQSSDYQNYLRSRQQR